MAPSVTLSIRRARLDDLAKVRRLEKRVWKQLAASRRQLHRRFFLFPAGFLVATVGNEIGGFCIGVCFDRDAREIEVDESFPPTHVPRGPYYVLYALTVNPIFRNQGIASRLIKRHLRLARRLDCHRVQLLANDFSRSTFERLGFGVIASLDNLFSQFPDLMPQAVLMERPIQP